METKEEEWRRPLRPRATSLVVEEFFSPFSFAPLKPPSLSPLLRKRKRRERKARASSPLFCLGCLGRGPRHCPGVFSISLSRPVRKSFLFWVIFKNTQVEFFSSLPQLSFFIISNPAQAEPPPLLAPPRPPAALEPRQ